jgi:hypothetical protein
MTEFWALLGQFVGRPSLVWRLAWLVFCLVVMVLFGARTLYEIAPSVLAGATGTAPKATPSPRDFGRLVTWVLPTVVWIFIVVAGTYVVFFR